MRSILLTLHGLDFYVHSLELKTDVWYLADPFLLALEFSRSYDPVAKYVARGDQITFHRLKSLCHRERVYVQPGHLLDDSIFINKKGILRLVNVQLENGQESANDFKAWMKTHLFPLFINKRHGIWDIIKLRFPEYSYIYQYTNDNGTDCVFDQVKFLTREELQAQYLTDIQICEENREEDQEYIRWFTWLEMHPDKCEILLEMDAEREFERIIERVYYDEHDDQENMPPSFL